MTGTSKALPSRSLVVPLAVALAAMAFLFSCNKVFDPDTWWHLATGRWVMENRLVPAHDIFSFATADAPWVAYSWLPATGMYLVHAAGGPAALVLVKAALISASFLLAFLLSVRARVHPWLAAAALALAIPVARFQFRDRPQILMFALVALFFWLLAEPGAERRRGTWLALGIAQVAWANVHGSFILGIALTGALLFERALGFASATVRRSPDRDLRGLVLSGGLLLLVTLASLATPYGLALVAQTLRDMLALGVSRSTVNEEFQPLSPRTYPGFVALAALTAASFLLSRRATRPFAAASAAGLALLAFSSVRFAGIAAFLFASVIALNLQPLAARLEEAARSSTRTRNTVFAILLGAFAAATFAATLQVGREERLGLGVNESRFPGAAVQFLVKSGFRGNLFNSWVHGGYVLWHLPQARDLVDGRALPAHLALLDHLGALDRDQLWRWLDQHDVKGALLTRDDVWLPLFEESPRFAKAFFDDRAVVYVRRDVDTGGAGAAYRFIRPESYDPSYLAPIARGPQASEAEAELRRAVADAPDSFTPRFLLAYFLESQGKPEALGHYVAAGRLNPGLAVAHYDLGTRAGAFALATGQAAQVEPFLREALGVKKGDPALEALLGSVLYVRKKDLPEAERLLRRALAGSPGLPVALTNLGYLLVDGGRAAEAVPFLERARRAAPTDEAAAYGLALALQAAGDPAAAADAWRQFLRLFPGSAWAPQARQRLSQLSGR